MDGKPRYFLTAYGLAVKYGYKGTEEEWIASLTAYGVAKTGGYEGTVEEWLDSLTAYGVAVSKGFEGTKEEWLESLTAYGVAVSKGFEGTKEEWLESLTAYGIAKIFGYEGTEEQWIYKLNDPVPAVSVGDTVTLPAGKPATVSIRGTKDKPIFDFGIPKGMGPEDALPLAGGVMTGDLSMGENRLTDLPDPAEPADAVNKDYADVIAASAANAQTTADSAVTAAAKAQATASSAVTAAANAQTTANNALPKSGGAMTGAMTVLAPTANMHPATRQYVDEKRKTYTATLTASGWSSSAPYTQTLTLSGLLATDMPHISPVYSGTLATALLEKESWAMVSKAVTAAGSVTFTCFEEKPTVNIPIQLEVNR